MLNPNPRRFGSAGVGRRKNAVALAGDTINIIWNGNSQKVEVFTPDLTIQGWAREGDQVPDFSPRIMPEATSFPALRIAANNVTLRYLSFINSTGNAGVVVDGVTGARVEKCQVGVTETDPAPNNTGIRLRNAAGAEIIDCEVAHNTNTGILVEGGEGTRITGTTAMTVRNNLTGIHLDQTQDAVISGFVYVNVNTGVGVRVSGSSRCEINGAAVASRPAGIRIEGGSRLNTVATSNVAPMTDEFGTVVTETGIFITGSDLNSFSENGFTMKAGPRCSCAWGAPGPAWQHLSAGPRLPPCSRSC